MKLPVAALIICLLSWPLIAGEMPVPTREDLPGSDITRDEVFIGGALWGLINGGADLYYEYGFDRMALQEITWQGEKFRLELYRMDSPLAAFGIFSVSRHGCRAGGLVVGGDCQNRYQYQFAAGSYYLSLINYSGNSLAGELSLVIAGIIASRIDGPEYSVPSFFRQLYFSDVVDEIKVFRGRLGLQNTLPSLAAAFESLDDYVVYYLELSENGERAGIMLIESCSFPEGKKTPLAEEYLMEGLYSERLTENTTIVVIPVTGSELHENFLKLIPAGIDQ